MGAREAGGAGQLPRPRAGRRMAARGVVGPCREPGLPCRACCAAASAPSARLPGRQLQCSRGWLLPGGARAMLGAADWVIGGLSLHLSPLRPPAGSPPPPACCPPPLSGPPACASAARAQSPQRSARAGSRLGVSGGGEGGAWAGMPVFHVPGVCLKGAYERLLRWPLSAATTWEGGHPPAAWCGSSYSDRTCCRWPRHVLSLLLLQPALPPLRLPCPL